MDTQNQNSTPITIPAPVVQPPQPPVPPDAHFVQDKGGAGSSVSKVLKIAVVLFILFAIPISYFAVKNFQSPGSHAELTLMTEPKPTLTPTPSHAPSPSPTPTVDLRRADINRSGVVDLSDFNILRSQMGKKCSPSSSQYCADIDCNQVIDSNDTALLQSVYGKTVKDQAPRCPYLEAGLSPTPTQAPVVTKSATSTKTLKTSPLK